jgi:hypothetical protein
MIDTRFGQIDFVVGLAPSDDPAEISASWRTVIEAMAD